MWLHSLILLKQVNRFEVFITKKFILIESTVCSKLRSLLRTFQGDFIHKLYLTPHKLKTVNKWKNIFISWIFKLDFTNTGNRRPCLLPGSGQFKCWSLVSIPNRLCSSELSPVLIFLWTKCLHEVRMYVESYPNADMAHCLTSVGHCGYFCRASMIWLWSSISLISWYSLWVLAAVLSTGRISSSCCRCSKAWGREKSPSWSFIQKDLNFASYQNLKSITGLILIFLQTFMMTGCSKLYMEFDFLCRNFLNSKRKTGKIRRF